MRTLIALALLYSHATAATIVGPGPQPPQLGIMGDYIFKDGTEIITDQLAAIGPFSGNYVFEGGLYQGQRAIYFNGGEVYMTIHGGEFCGATGPAITMNQRTILHWTIYGGQFVGGYGAAAIDFGSFSYLYGGQVNVYGGEFLGGFNLNKPVVLSFHGSDFAISPAPVNGKIVGLADITVSGKYPDGAPFSHVIHPTFGRVVVQNNGALLAFQIPEPSAILLALTGWLWCGRRGLESRRRSSRR